jgi:hypothetical protein
VFEHTDISLAQIQNGLELYRVNPSVFPAAPGYNGERVWRIEQASVGVPWQDDRRTPYALRSLRGSAMPEIAKAAQSL